MDEHFVAIKFMLDKHDPENFAKNYEITFYPTFVIIDTEGKEKIRTSGAPDSPAAYNEMLASLLPAEKSWSEYDKKLLAQPSFIQEYHDILKEAHLDTKADMLRFQIFENSTMKVRFNKTNMAYYNRYIWDFNNPILQFMMNNVDEVDEVLGEGECLKFLYYKADSQFSRSASRDISAENFDKYLSLGEKYPILQSTLYWFYKDNIDAILEKDLYPILKAAYKAALKGEPNTNYYTYSILNRVGDIRNPEVELSKKEIKLLMKYLDEIIKVETVKPRMKWFTDIQERYK